MFRIVTKHLFWWPIVVRVPSPDLPGAIAEQTFAMQFEAITDERARAIEATPGEAVDLAERTKDFIVAVSRGWRDVEDEDGVAVPFSPEALRSLAGFSWVRTGVIEAYRQAMAGEAARLGN